MDRLAASAVQVRVRDPREPDARFCLQAYFTELSRRFDSGFDPGRSIPASDEELTPPAGWGSAAGCWPNWKPARRPTTSASSGWKPTAP